MNGSEWRKLVFDRLEKHGMLAVGFGLTGIAWNKKSQLTGLEWWKSSCQKVVKKLSQKVVKEFKI
jgi:hypothetical protein